MKRLRYQTGPLDAVDAGILQVLASDGRVSMSDLARRVGLSAPSVAERVRRLEEAGVIRGYTAVVDAGALGLPLAVLLRIRPMPGRLPQVVSLLGELPEIVECDRVTGEDCFVAKAHVRDVGQLEALIDQIIPYAMTNTSVIQSTPVRKRLPRVGATLAG